METRDLLLVIGFLRSGRMIPITLPLGGLSVSRSLRVVLEAMAEQEQALFHAGGAAGAGGDDPTLDIDDIKRRAALRSWSGAELVVGTRVGEVPDPGVVLCVLSDGPIASAPLPIDITAQTLRRYVVRSAELKRQFDAHVDNAGTFVPAWVSPDERRQKSQEAFDAAMKVAREQGFAMASALFEGVRGECFPEAQIAIAVYEIRELGEIESGLTRLAEVVRVAPGNIAARMLRAKTLMRDPGRLVEAASDFLVVLRELGRSEGTARSGPASSFRLDAPPGSGLGGGAAVSPPARAVHQEATLGLWSLHRQFADARALDVALAVAKVDPARGFEALSRYVHTHPCAWDAQAHLGTLALAARRFDVTTKMLGNVRWLFPDDPNPHFVYGQALASQGRALAAVAALEHAAALSPGDPDIAAWLGYAREQSAGEPRSRRAKSIHLSHHVARSLLLVAGFVRAGRVSPAALATPKLPGDFPFAFALHEIAELEKQHGGSGVGVAGRCVLSDYSGAGVRAEGTIGEIPDPGVVVVLVYAEPWQDAAGRPFEGMSPAQCRASLLRAAQANSAISAALERHLASEEATIKARLGSA